MENFLFDRTSFDHMFHIIFQFFCISENNIIFLRSHFEYYSNFFIKKCLKPRSEVDLIKQEEPTNIGGLVTPCEIFQSDL